MAEDTENWSAFLGRTPAPPDATAIRHKVAGKVVVVTGAGGFIGSALARTIAAYDPAHLVLLDSAERGLNELENSFSNAGQTPPSHEMAVGDVGDAPLLQHLFSRHRPHIVFHAAALKHVWLMESNPLAAARVNILGTAGVLTAANEAGVENFILVSTDKAVEPVSWMGATKRVAELLVLGSRDATRATALRLGNVLGSTGSVAPLLAQQIAHGFPLTLTNRACTRFFLSIDEVVSHLLGALLIDEPAAILLPDPGAPRLILDLARFLVERTGRSFAAQDVCYMGLRPGEKLEEKLIADDEVGRDAKLGGMQILTSRNEQPGLNLFINRLRAAVEKRNVDALLRTISAILPEYQPSATLLLYAESPPKSVEERRPA